jgi:hypothetical protein
MYGDGMEPVWVFICVGFVGRKKPERAERNLRRDERNGMEEILLLWGALGSFCEQVI